MAGLAKSTCADCGQHISEWIQSRTKAARIADPSRIQGMFCSEVKQTSLRQACDGPGRGWNSPALGAFAVNRCSQPLSPPEAGRDALWRAVNGAFQLQNRAGPNQLLVAVLALYPPHVAFKRRSVDEALPALRGWPWLRACLRRCALTFSSGNGTGPAARLPWRPCGSCRRALDRVAGPTYRSPDFAGRPFSPAVFVWRIRSCPAAAN
jgi:hypothetical protein